MQKNLMLKFFASDVLFIPGESSPLIAIMYETTPMAFPLSPCIIRLPL